MNGAVLCVAFTCVCCCVREGAVLPSLLPCAHVMRAGKSDGLAAIPLVQIKVEAPPILHRNHAMHLGKHPRRNRGVKVLALDLLSVGLWVCPCLSWVVAGCLGPVVWSGPAWSSAQFIFSVACSVSFSLSKGDDPRTDLSARHLLTPVVQERDMLWPWCPIVARTSFFYLFVRSLLFAMMLTLLVTGLCLTQYLLRGYSHLDHDQQDVGGKSLVFTGRMALGACFDLLVDGLLDGRPLSQTLSCFRITMRKRLCFETYGFPCCRVPSRIKCWCGLIS